MAKRMKNVTHKKRLVLALAALIYRKTGKGFFKEGNYAATYRLLTPCLTEEMQMRLTEHWIRVRLKRLGLGMSRRHPDEAYDYEGWKVTRLTQLVYKTYSEITAGEVTIFSHHHKNGSAFEAAGGKCWHCKEEIPANLKTFDKLIKLRRKIS